jgi:hypothetical protein
LTAASIMAVQPLPEKRPKRKLPRQVDTPGRFGKSL